MEQLYVVERVKGWDAPIRSKSRLRTKPKRYFADPARAASLLQVTSDRLLEDGQLFGLLFESLAMHDLGIYARALPDASRLFAKICTIMKHVSATAALDSFGR